ncbi:MULTISPECIES: PTS system mannose/fructose/N-acetylgalactosamine-transporter subunit IIB [Klebsiella/Raoultella group]|uniref:PTS system mannose/fructose/N-acetylgalactosamine-transporter subunit IIB n=1 Tax=Klebsiella/Raoultella group TaxID=2890311 RepID=UPI0012B97982|nr:MULTISPECIES: PTS sugar transporter subunit IIB [Klebsiella]MDW2731039.1 PTS sugar transporter subunit IIB [Raoultella planticola]MBX8921046.1 PTS sugar transporter subunit IIB [Klebsiella michiganensis]MCM6077341.1 PTS sugar transporter subunit IIB [Klebsiella pneumoniae]MDV1908980.1 PTS sugar transporter subunit IIB [Klebsiella pasteurii]MDV1914759.1 PTS sugar transporter subunit IIB [Klebsiella pasteurii]
MSHISLLRIDDRLIHGQVMTGWVKHLSATRIIIVDDELVNDEFMISVLEMAVPSHMSLNIYNVETASEVLNSVHQDGKDDKIIILVKSPIPVLKMLEKGTSFKELTVGGMGVNEHRTRLYRNLAASQAERDSFKDIEKLGLPINIQVLPNDTPTTLMQYL